MAQFCWPLTVDINQAPIPLAFEIIQTNNVLFCRDEDRLWQETLRIHSRMELDYAYYRRTQAMAQNYRYA